jgi:hypothetical protein
MGDTKSPKNSWKNDKRVVARQGVDGQQLLQALLAPRTEGFGAVR